MLIQPSAMKNSCRSLPILPCRCPPEVAPCRGHLPNLGVVVGWEVLHQTAEPPFRPFHHHDRAVAPMLEHNRLRHPGNLLDVHILTPFLSASADCRRYLSIFEAGGELRRGGTRALAHRGKSWRKRGEGPLMIGRRRATNRTARQGGSAGAIRTASLRIGWNGHGKAAVGLRPARGNLLRLLGLKKVEELPGAHYGHTLVTSESLEPTIASDQVLSLC